ncbi:MAG: hypothetical protein QOE06_557 [Thermoleophilaceae bacterium]|jgi:hypothetical protein|nr:hypothetical protein [Thermoleophilaceae bacterium]
MADSQALKLTGELPVTVVVPAYNRADMLRRSLASIAAQRPERAAEVIVVDDGSSDDTAATAERLGARVIRHERNRGLATARNTGLEHATHPWVALLDSDDEWLEHHLATLWPLRGDHVLLGASSLRCYEDPSRDRFHGPVTRRPMTVTSPSPVLYPGALIPVSTALLQRDVALEVGGFRAHHGVVEDLDLWVRMLERGSALFCPKVTLIYHMHEEQMSGDPAQMQAGHLAVVDAYEGRPWWSPDISVRWSGVAAWDNLRLAQARGDRPGMLRHAWAIVRNPQRLIGALGMLGWRFMVRRRSGEVARDGDPSVAVLPGAAIEPDPSGRLAGRPVVDLRPYGSFARAWLRLLRRPSGAALTQSRLQALALRAIGVRPLSRPPAAS